MALHDDRYSSIAAWPYSPTCYWCTATRDHGRSCHSNIQSRRRQIFVGVLSQSVFRISIHLFSFTRGHGLVDEIFLRGEPYSWKTADFNRFQRGSADELSTDIFISSEISTLVDEQRRKEESMSKLWVVVIELHVIVKSLDRDIDLFLSKLFECDCVHDCSIGLTYVNTEFGTPAGAGLKPDPSSSRRSYVREGQKKTRT